MDILEEIELWFPNIVGHPLKIYKTEELDYNCLAHVLGLKHWIWTNEKWPKPNVPRDLGLESFRLLFKEYGYSIITENSYEIGYDKIAIYVKNGYPTHVCKQSQNMWQSKLGTRFYILEHKLEWLTGDTDDAYGEIGLIVKRKII